MVQCVGTLY